MEIVRKLLELSDDSRLDFSDDYAAHEVRRLTHSAPTIWRDVAELILRDGVPDGQRPANKRIAALCAWIDCTALDLPDVFVKGLTSKDSDVRFTCMRQLQRSRWTHEAHRAAETALQHRLSSIRGDAATLLERLGAGQALPQLLDQADREKGKTARRQLERAIETLGGRPDQRDELVWGPLRKRAATAQRNARVSNALLVLLDQTAPKRDRDGEHRIWSTTALAEATQLTEDEVERELAAVIIDYQDDPMAASARYGHPQTTRVHAHLGGFRLGDTGDYGVLLPSPRHVERAVQIGEYAVVETALSRIKRSVRPARLRAHEKPIAQALPQQLQEPLPELRWLDGSELQEDARKAYLWHLVYGYVEIPHTVDPALSEESRLHAALWACEQYGTSGARRRVPSGVDAVASHLLSLYLDGELRKPWDVTGILTSPLGIRLAYVWGSLDNEEAVERAMPDGDDPSGTAASWQGWIRRILHRAMREQRPLRVKHLRQTYAINPLASPLLSRVVFRAGERLFTLTSACHARLPQGQIEELAPSCTVVVAHPADGTEEWPEVTDPLFEQRTRRVFDTDALPPIKGKPIALDDWTERRRALGWTVTAHPYQPVTETTRVHRRVRAEAKLTGYGHEDGGQAPVELVRLKVADRQGPGVATYSGAQRCRGWDSLPAWLRSEMIYEARVLFGYEELADFEPKRPARPCAPIEGVALEKGEKVRIRRGPGAGQEGSIFWIGPSRYGDGIRVGLTDGNGDIHWVAADEVQVV